MLSFMWSACRISSAVGSSGMQCEMNVALAFGLSSERAFQVHNLEISAEPFQPCTATKVIARIPRER